MNHLFNNQQNLNEIIFANRNKSYGAYAIRSAYGSTIFKSLSIMIFGFGTFICAAYYFSNKNNMPEENNAIPFEGDTMVTVFKMPEPDVEKPHETNPAKGGGGSSSDNTSTTISDTVSVDTHSVINTDPVNTTVVNTGTPGIGPENTGTTTITTSITSTVSAGASELFSVDAAPEYEGGLNALRMFVAKNVKYPVPAQEAYKQGTVFVKFVVDEKGKVCNLTLLNNLGYGLDEEALRVIGMIPNFKSPAKVKGQAVKVYYQLPIKFKLN
jgi:protein TonB